MNNENIMYNILHYYLYKICNFDIILFSNYKLHNFQHNIYQMKYIIRIDYINIYPHITLIRR